MTLPRRALILGSLLPWAARAAEPETGAMLLCPLAAAPDVLVPGLGDGLGTLLVGSNLYRGLTRLDADGNAVPDLATWSVSPDRLRYRFRLQTGLQWHDGVPITAADAVFSLDRLHRAQNPRLDLAPVASIAAAGPQSVLITLRQPFEPLLRELNALNAAIVPQHVHDVPRWGLDPSVVKPVGTGAFRYDGWLRLTRFGGPPPALAGVVFPILPELADRVAAVQRGRPALMVETLMDGATAARLRADTALVVEAADPPGWSGWAELRLNPQRSPLNQPAVRLALATAIDRNALLWAVWDGFGSVPLDAPAYDVRAASAQLQAAGLRPDDDGMRAQLHLLLPPDPAAARLAAALTRMLSLVAVELAPETPDLAEWRRRVASGDYDLALDLHGRGAKDGTSIRLARPALAVARDRRLHLPGGVLGGFASATLA